MTGPCEKGPSGGVDSPFSGVQALGDGTTFPPLDDLDRPSRHLNRPFPGGTMSAQRKLGLLAAAVYITVVVLANVLSSHYGMVSVGFGLMASAGTYAAGAALGMRDAVQDGLGRWAVLVVILIGSGLSYMLASEVIATASLAAFAASELADLIVYTPLRERGWSRAVIASNVVGAVVDTYVFLALAPFGPVTWHAMQGQLVGKILWATLLPVALVAAVRKAREA